MPIEVEIPEIGSVEFPEGMSREDVAREVPKVIQTFHTQKGLGAVNTAINLSETARTATDVGLLAPSLPDAGSELKPESANQIPSTVATTAGGPQLRASGTPGAMTTLTEEAVAGLTAPIADVTGVLPRPTGRIGALLRTGTAPEKMLAGAAGGMADLVEGVANYLSSAQGITELTATKTPLAPLVALKWAKDMVQGGMISSGEAYDAYKSGDMEAFGKHVTTGLAQLLGAGGILKHGLSKAQASAESFVPRGQGIASPELKALAPATAAAIEQTTPITTEVQNASQVTSPESVSQPEIRPPVGESPSLRQQGEIAPARQTIEEVKAPETQGQTPAPANVENAPHDLGQPIKEPWQMTRAEVHNGQWDVNIPGGSKPGEHTLNLEIAHRSAIRKALSEGKPVPPEVLADYPDLQPPAPVVFDSMFGPMPMFRVTSEFAMPGLEGPPQTVGSKVTLDALQKAGLKVPEAELSKIPTTQPTGETHDITATVAPEIGAVGYGEPSGTASQSGGRPNVVGLRPGASYGDTGTANYGAPRPSSPLSKTQRSGEETRGSPEIIERINKRDRRDWKGLPAQFELDAVRAAFNDIKELFPKKAISQRVRASKATTFSELRQSVDDALQKYRPDLLPSTENAPPGGPGSAAGVPLTEVSGGKVPAAEPAPRSASTFFQLYLGRFLDDSFAQQGYPKAVESLKGWSTTDLQSERRNMVKASLNPMFGKNAEKALTLIENELQARLEPEGVQPALKPEMTGMGAAVPTEFEQPGSYVSNMFAAIDRDRAEMGKEPMPETKKRTWDEDNQKALAMMNRDPNWIPNLLADVKQNPRPLLSWENAGVVWHRAKLRAEYNNALKRIAQAFDDGRADDLSQAKSDAQIYENALLDLDATVGRGGTGSEAGRSLVAQKMAAGDDFSLVEMRLQKRKAVGGRQLTEAESKEIERIHTEYQAKLKELESHLAQREAKAREEAFQEAYARIEKEAKAAQPAYHHRVLKLAEKFATYMDGKANEALDRIKQKITNPGAMSVLDPTLLDDLAIVGAAKITRGFVEAAKWADEMRKAVGDWITPHLDTVRKAAESTFEKESAGIEKRYGSVMAERVKKVITKEESPAEKTNVQELSDKIKEKATDGKLGEITFYAHKLARAFVESGVKDREALIDAVHGVLKEAIPDLERRETMDAISGYGRFKQLTKDEISVQLRDLKGQMQQLAKLEDMASGKAPLKTGIERRSPSDTERQLIQLVNEAKKKGGYDVTDPETQLASAQAARLTFLRNRIADITAEIQTRTPIVKDRTQVPTTPEIEALRAEYKKLKAERDELFNTSIHNAKNRMLKTFEDLTDRITRGDYSRRTRKPVDISNDPEAMMIKGELERIRREFEKGKTLSEMQQRGTGQKIYAGTLEALNLPKAVWSSYDVSAVGRQGGFIGAGNPLRAARSIVPMLKALASEREALAIEQQILHRPNAPLYAKSKLYLASLDEFRLSKMEEIIMSRYANLIPGVRASNRAFMTYLNKLRADSFDAMLNSRKRWFEGEPTQAEMDAIANYVNIATGRGNIGKSAGAAEALATVFWSPRLVASRFQLLLGQPLYRGGMPVRALIALEYGKSLTGLAAIVGLGYLMGASISLDSNSSDFLKLKIGNTRLDIFGGLIQNTVLLSRLKTGKMTLPTGKEADAKSSDVIASFLRSKLSPSVGMALDIRDISVGQKTPAGHPQTLPKMAQRSVVPLAWQDILEVMKEQGVPEGIAIEFLSALGVGVQNYEDKKRTR